tara:strand:+ start:686 stop:1180 length:495 start_codon:yes stop_codon:yes gene_type:complete
VRWLFATVLIILLFPFAWEFMQSAKKTTPAEDVTEEQLQRLMERQSDMLSDLVENIPTMQESAIAMAKTIPTMQESAIALINVVKEHENANSEKMAKQVTLLNKNVEIFLNLLDKKDFIRAKIKVMEIKWIPNTFGGDAKKRNEEMTDHYNEVREELLKLLPEK